MKRFLLSLGLIFALSTQGFAANEVTTSQQYTQGQQVQSTDLAGDFEAVRNLSGILATLLLGSPDALPNNNPLAITLSPSAMSLSLGGAGQFVIAQDLATSGNARLIDSCPAQTISVPINTSGATRNDLLSIQYQQLPVNGHSVTFSDGSVRTVYNAVEGCAYSYNTNTSTPPAGYVGFAKVAIPPGATTASQGTVTYLFSTVQALLRQQLGGVVTAVNSYSGSINIVGSSGITVSNSGGNTVTIGTTLATSSVTSLNLGTGAQTIESNEGTITVTTPDAHHINLKANFPTVVNQVNGQNSNVTIVGGIGNNVTTSAGTITITNTGVTGITAGTGITASSGTGNVTLSSFFSSSGTHVEYANCAAGTTAANGYWYCTATFPGTGFTSGYLCATGFNEGGVGAAGFGAGTGYYKLSYTQVNLYQNQTVNGVVSAICVGT